MKSFVLLVICCMPVVGAADVLTVSNDPSQPAQYTDIPSAIAAAVSGDTIYIHGSSSQYFSGAYNIDKPLTLIGPGKTPRTQHGTMAVLGGAGGAGGSVFFRTGSAGSRVIGIRVTGTITDADGVANILIQGCVTQRAINGNSQNGSSNWILRDNVIRLDNGVVNPNAISPGLNSSGWIIENNLVGGRLYQCLNHTLRHNIFIQNQSAIGDLFANSCSNLLMEDNIFYGVALQACTSCTFNYNLTFGATNPNIPTGATATGNVIDQNPLFLNASLTSQTSQWQVTDWRLGAGSPAGGSGSTGDDIGLYGVPSATISGNAVIPEITEFSIDNLTVPAGGVLQVHVKAIKAEDP